MALSKFAGFLASIVRCMLSVCSFCVAVCPLTVGKISTIVGIHAIYHIHLLVPFLLVCVCPWNVECEILTLLKLMIIPLMRIRISPFEQQTQSLCVYFFIRIQDNIYKIQEEIADCKYTCSTALVWGIIGLRDRYSFVVQRYSNKTMQTDRDSQLCRKQKNGIFKFHFIQGFCFLMDHNYL